MTCAPARTSPSISRSTAGTGARAPAPVSSSGSSCSAHARRWRCPVRGAAARTALVIDSDPRSGSISATMPSRVLVGFGPARDAVRALLTVADTNRPELPAVGARLGFGTACPAVPVLPATLQGSQRLAAVGAYGCRDVARACVAQRDEQVPDHGRCRGTPVAQQ